MQGSRRWGSIVAIGSIPKIEGDALRAVKHRGGHVQIIASAGSGKTEVVAQQVAELFVKGEAPDAAVAFTFTERAADSLTLPAAIRHLPYYKRAPGLPMPSRDANTRRSRTHG
jgi:hypothetical protein